jgi:hypothetical protein
VVPNYRALLLGPADRGRQPAGLLVEPGSVPAILDVDVKVLRAENLLDEAWAAAMADPGQVPESQWFQLIEVREMSHPADVPYPSCAAFQQLHASCGLRLVLARRHGVQVDHLARREREPC